MQNKGGAAHQLHNRKAAESAAIARLYYDLFNHRRFDEAAAMLLPRACFLHLPTKQRLIGPAGYRTFAQAWVHAFPDALVEITGISVGEDAWVKVDFIGYGTHSGLLNLGEVQFPPTSRRVHLPFLQSFDIQQGRIAEAVLEFDLDAMRALLSP